MIPLKFTKTDGSPTANRIISSLAKGFMRPLPGGTCELRTGSVGLAVAE